jgi:hypothetical protein
MLISSDSLDSVPFGEYSATCLVGVATTGHHAAETTPTRLWALRIFLNALPSIYGLPDPGSVILRWRSASMSAGVTAVCSSSR